MNREGNTFFLSALQNYNFYIAMEKLFQKKKGKNRKNREYSDVIQFLRWGKSITLTIGGRVHVASESSKHSLIFFFFVARVLKSKDIQTIDEQYHLEITMGMVGWVKWDAGEWKRVRHFVLLKMQNKNVPTFVFFFLFF